MITITISLRAVLIAAFLAITGFCALYASETLGSGGTPDSILQGDVNCDGVVDAQDALGDLRYVGGLDVEQDEPCPDVGTLAAIPGPSGPPGPQGSEGPAGPQGPPGVSGYEVVELVDTALVNMFAMSRIVSCPDGSKALGGGVDPDDSVSAYVNSSEPTSNGWRTAYRAEVGQTIPQGTEVTFYAICASVGE